MPGPAPKDRLLRAPVGALTSESSADGSLLLRSPLLTQLGLPHVFTTRLWHGRRDFGLGPLSPDERHALPASCGLAPGTPLCWARQVHGRQALEVAGEAWDSAVEADGLISSRSDRLLMVYSADCVPILVASADGRRVAAIHAGWRGLVAGVIPAALGAWAQGGVAAIGPCLGLQFAEMGPEVLERFHAAELSPAVHEPAGQRGRVDVRLAARLQLARAGVERVDVSELCTYAQAGELYSYRREVTHGGAPSTGRLFGLIAARKSAPVN